ncbi:MAG TPA: hypothetical protein VMS17_32130, partial [Gemmataceae bacterium]|nr:hypothetical protein [Gemmataceae bacterium]
AYMEARGLDVVGIRGDGWIVGYVPKDSLESGVCGQWLHPLDEAILLSDAAPLLRVLQGLNRAPFLFLTAFGRVAGLVTRADLQKAPARMWLFGVVTMIEMRFAELIERHCPADSWKQFLSEARLQKAQEFLSERVRRRRAVQLLDCLQFSDKGQIIARHEGIRKTTVFASRSQAEEAVKRLEKLRNNLAHAQDIVSGDWETIVQLCEFMSSQ